LPKGSPGHRKFTLESPKRFGEEKEENRTKGYNTSYRLKPDTSDISDVGLDISDRSDISSQVLDKFDKF
jgi:hypothetical protein